MMLRKKTKVKTSAKIIRLALKAAFTLGAVFGSKKSQQRLEQQNKKR